MNDRHNHQTTADAVDLRHYIKTINADAKGGFLLIDDLDHWAGYGIYTKADLGDYLSDLLVMQQPYNSCDSNDDDYIYDPPEPTWDAVSRHDSNEGW